MPRPLAYAKDVIARRRTGGLFGCWHSRRATQQVFLQSFGLFENQILVHHAKSSHRHEQHQDNPACIRFTWWTFEEFCVTRC